MPEQLRKQDQKLIDEFIAWLDSHGYTRRTLDAYRRDLERLAVAKGPLLRITTADLRAHMHDLGGRPSSRAARWSAWNTFFRYHVEELGDLSANPVDGLPRPKVEKKLHPEIVHVDEALRALPIPARLAAEFVLETGVSKMELESVRVRGSVGSQIVVEGRRGKARRVYLSPHARRVLQELGGGLPKGMQGRQLQREVEKVDLSLERLEKISRRIDPAALPLHPRLDLVIRRLVEHRDSEEAVFGAFKEVEIRVRELAELPDLIGVDLMRQAFGEKGRLADPSAKAGERVATMELFAGAVGAFKNPFSHRRMTRPAAEIAELLALANFLMRELDRVEARLNQPPP